MNTTALVSKFELIVVPSTLLAVYLYWLISVYEPIQNAADLCARQYCKASILPLSSIAMFSMLIFGLTYLLILNSEFRRDLLKPFFVFKGLTFTFLRLIIGVLVLNIFLCFYFSTNFAVGY